MSSPSSDGWAKTRKKTLKRTGHANNGLSNFNVCLHESPLRGVGDRRRTLGEADSFTELSPSPRLLECLASNTSKPVASILSTTLELYHAVVDVRDPRFFPLALPSRRRGPAQADRPSRGGQESQRRSDAADGS